MKLEILRLRREGFKSDQIAAALGGVIDPGTVRRWLRKLPANFQPERLEAGDLDTELLLAAQWLESPPPRFRRGDGYDPGEDDQSPPDATGCTLA